MKRNPRSVGLAQRPLGYLGAPLLEHAARIGQLGERKIAELFFDQPELPAVVGLGARRELLGELRACLELANQRRQHAFGRGELARQRLVVAGN